jgi:hypothetical protein
MQRITVTVVALMLGLIAAAERPASAQLMPKAQVANLISKVENGVDEFRDYLEKRGENARDAGNTAQASGRRKKPAATENQKAAAASKKDALDDALGDLNRGKRRYRMGVTIGIDARIEFNRKLQPISHEGDVSHHCLARDFERIGQLGAVGESATTQFFVNA